MTFGGDHSAGIYEKLGPEAVRPVMPRELEVLFTQQGCLRACRPGIDEWVGTVAVLEDFRIDCPTTGCNKTVHIGRGVVSCSGECPESTQEHVAYLRNHP